MSDNDSSQTAIGPVDIVVIGYPAGSAQTGEAIPIMVDLVDRGIIHILDVRGVRKDEDGTFSGFDIADADGNGVPDLIAFDGVETGLIGDEDLRVAVDAMEPGSAAVLIVFENRWAAPFVSAVHRNGGQVIAYERVPAEDLLEAVEALEAAE
jgi:hypothetical protein